MKNIFLALCIIFANICFAQQEKLFYYNEYSEKFDHTYLVITQYLKSETNEKGKVYVNITAYKGKIKDRYDTAYLKSIQIAETEITLNIKSIKTDNSINESYEDVIDRATYTLMTSLDTIENPIPPKENSDMGSFQIAWALIPEFNINNGIMLATLGKDSIMLKGLDGLVLDGESSKSDGEKHLSEYGTMHFLFKEVDDASKPNQFNKIIVQVTEKLSGKFKLKLHYRVWEGNNEKKLKNMLGDIVLQFDITDIDMSRYDEKKTAKLKVVLDKENSNLSLQPADDYEGYFFNFANALTENTEWIIDVARGVYFSVGTNNIVFNRDYNTDNFLQD